MTRLQIERIIAAGGGIVVDAGSLTTVQIRDLAAVAKNAKATITLKNIGLVTAEQLAEIAAIAPGFVVFDLT
jgi:seryl-tRNA(Sec) selenium transferase